MLIQPPNTSTVAPFPKTTQALPDLDKVSVTDRFVQSGTGALITGIPAALGWAGGAVGEAVAGLPGKIVGGLVVGVAVGVGSAFGIGKVPSEDETVRKRVALRTSLLTGLSAFGGAIGGGLGVAAVATGGALFSGQALDLAEALLAHGPQRRSTDKPDYVEEHILKTSDGLGLQAWWTPGPKEAPVALFFHSNGTNLEENLGRVDMLRDLGFRVLATEYRGYGGNAGIPTESGLKKDARAAYEFALKHAPAEKILIAGQSMGAGVAANLAGEKPHGALVLESGFESLSSASKGEMGELVAKLTRGRYPTVDTVRDLNTPIFVAHGGWDHMFAAETGRNIASRNPAATLFEAPQAGHMDVYQADGFKAALQAFVTQSNLNA